MLQELQNHWNQAYQKSPVEQLGWYEENSTPTLELIKKTNVPKEARILNVGVGASTIIDDLLKENYTHLIASDLSDVSLNTLKKRIKSEDIDKVQFVVDDLTNPTKLPTLNSVDLWNDRAVLHFFTTPKDQQTYFDLLRKIVKPKGFVILAEFALNGAEKCCGLDVFRYNSEMLQERLGDDFELLESSDYTFINPRGGERPYVYTLFQRK